jgi:ubiquinone/menaquinone biosynthesis C-methylase UbiE
MRYSPEEHERIMREVTNIAWVPGSTYDTVESSRLPVINAMKKAYRRKLEPRMPSEGKVLVIGAGRGFDREIIPSNIPDSRIVYTDLNLGALKKLKERRSSPAAQASSFNLPFKDGEFAAVFSSDHLDVFPKNLLPEVVAEARRVIRPGGALIACQSSVPTITHWSPNPDALWSAYETHKYPQDFTRNIQETHRRYRQAAMNAMKSAGFHGVDYIPAVDVHLSEEEPRHKIPTFKRPRDPTIAHDMGTLGMASLDAVPFKTLQREFGAHIKKPTMSELSRMKSPVTEIFSGYLLYGHVPKTGQAAHAQHRKKKRR